MPKYIDATAFEKWANENLIEINKDTLRLAPAADVIPITWIHGYINENYEKYTVTSVDYILGEFDIRARTIDLYTDLIKEWRKQNG